MFTWKDNFDFIIYARKICYKNVGKNLEYKRNTKDSIEKNIYLVYLALLIELKKSEFFNL